MWFEARVQQPGRRLDQSKPAFLSFFPIPLLDIERISKGDCAGRDRCLVKAVKQTVGIKINRKPENRKTDMTCKEKNEWRGVLVPERRQCNKT